MREPLFMSWTGVLHPVFGLWLACWDLHCLHLYAAKSHLLASSMKLNLDGRGACLCNISCRPWDNDHVSTSYVYDSQDQRDIIYNMRKWLGRHLVSKDDCGLSIEMGLTDYVSLKRVSERSCIPDRLSSGPLHRLLILHDHRIELLWPNRLTKSK